VNILGITSNFVTVSLNKFLSKTIYRRELTHSKVRVFDVAKFLTIFTTSKVTEQKSKN